MASLIAKKSIQDVLNAASILDLLKDYTEIKRSGKNWMGLCPFHEEGSPSFSLSPEKNVYHCFGCGVSGNAITFLKAKEGLSFSEAIETLASRFNIALVYEQNKKADESEKLYRVNEVFQALFISSFKEKPAEAAREYLKAREFSMDTISRCGLGFAGVSPKELQAALNKESLDPALAVKLGLIHSDCNLKYRGRLTIPILDHRVRICGFGARSLSDEKPKYINSPESEIYAKRMVLYGLNWSKEAISQKDYCIVCEGYLDFLRLAQVGITNAVACSGTALTINQLQLIKRFTQRVLFVYDGDEAGTLAAIRSFPLVLSTGLDAKVLTLPNGSDPDSFIREKGREAFKEICQKSLPILDFFIASSLSSGKSTQKVAALAQELSKVFEKIANPVTRELLIKESAGLLGISFQSFLKLCQKAPVPIQPMAPVSSSPLLKYRESGLKFPKEEWILLKLFSIFPSHIDDFEFCQALEFFQNETLLALGHQIFELKKREETKLSPAYIYQELSDPHLKEVFAKLIVKIDEIDESNSERMFADCLKRLKKKWIDFQKKKISEEIAKSELNGDYNRVFELLEAKKNISKETLYAATGKP